MRKRTIKASRVSAFEMSHAIGVIDRHLGHGGACERYTPRRCVNKQSWEVSLRVRMMRSVSVGGSDDRVDEDVAEN